MDLAPATSRSKTAKVVSPKVSLSIPIHVATDVEGRVCAFIGSMMRGSHGGPVVVITVGDTGLLAAE